MGSTNSFKGVIDSASPYITVYARTEQFLEAFWHLIDGTNGNTFNCNYTTRECGSTDPVMNVMTFNILNPDNNNEILWNISLFKEDIMNGDYIQFLNGNDTDFTSDTDFVLFLGRPFLKHVVVTLDYNEETIQFYNLYEPTSSLNWGTIGIVFGCVIAFALIFFGIYYWKYGKIQAPSNHDVEEQSLLRGPVQAVGTGSGAINQSGPNSAAFSGISGLDEDDDYQHQMVAQRQSAIEAQQRREQQLRMDRERQLIEEQKQQSQLQQAQRQSDKQQQRIGSSSGAAKPSNADDLRRRRLKMFDQPKEQQQDNDDQ